MQSDSCTAARPDIGIDNRKEPVQNHFLKSSKNVYIPYILQIGGGTFSSYPVTMYVRAVSKAAASAAPAACTTSASAPSMQAKR